MTGNLFDIAAEPIPVHRAAKARAMRQEGRQRRDKGAKAVLQPRPVFKALAGEIIADFIKRGETITAERVQVEFLARFPGAVPPHPNAWGAVILGAAKRGLIRFTGRYVATVKPASHARQIRVWEGV